MTRLYKTQVVAFLMAVCACATLGYSQSATFSVRVAQNGQLLPTADGEVHLEPGPFVLQFRFNGASDLLVNASETSETFNAAREGLPFSALPGFLQTGMAEEWFNSTRELILSTDAPHAWFFENDSMHRFDSCVYEGSTLVCNRSVAGFLDGRELSSGEIPSLYLVFVLYTYDQATYEVLEYQRESLHLIFE
ncbi:MAG: hypothetical protein KC561_00980 [Myxococcales bacterium]|nr:hypothetical protein [Myxococcales bacterium]